jgi:fatty-acyl-CoA synthase
VPDEKYGEELCVWIQLRDGAAGLDADALRAFCHGRLAHYKIPRHVMVVDEFPMTVTGKVQKNVMREVTVKSLGLAGAPR